jgi:hypothetical protein
MSGTMQAEVSGNDVLHHILEALDVLVIEDERRDGVVSGVPCCLRAELAGQTARVVSKAVGLRIGRDVGPDGRHRPEV